jgi:uncharacterized protein YaaN involved in tellurite resistance
MDNKNESSKIPELTLDPTPNASASGAAEALFDASNTDNNAVAEDKKVVEPVKLDITTLSPEEQAAVKEFSKKIDVMNTEQVLNYGASAQKNVAAFSESALKSVRTKDMGEAGDMLSKLVVQLKNLNYNDDDKKGFLGLFRKANQSIEQLKAQYNKAEVNVDKIVEELQKHEVELMKDISLLDKMYEKNSEYQKELAMYIIAGKIKIQELREKDLPKAQQKAKESGLAEDAQAANDLANMINRFDKKIHDLELTRMISVQMAPQIRMIQNNDNLMAEKIHSSIVNTIPLWKSQMVMSLSLYHAQEATEAQRDVTDATNRLLQENAQKLHQGSVEIAKETERGIVDMETLTKTNKELIDTLTEVQEIQNSGREKRAAAEAELGRIEGELKEKLLEIRG